jgi:N-acyl-D-aspartate/D-glutamate deacylase
MLRISMGRRAVPVVLALTLVGGMACRSSTVETTSPAAAVTALTNARVIDGTGGAPLDQATVIIRDGIIEAVGAASAVTIPAGATVVDMAGKTIMPGMINAHGHVQKGHDASIPVREDLLRRLGIYASYGVTTVVSLGAVPDDESVQLSLRDEQEGIALDRARVYTSG